MSTVLQAAQSEQRVTYILADEAAQTVAGKYDGSCVLVMQTRVSIGKSLGTRRSAYRAIVLAIRGEGRQQIP